LTGLWNQAEKLKARGTATDAVFSKDYWTKEGQPTRMHDGMHAYIGCRSVTNLKKRGGRPKLDQRMGWSFPEKVGKKGGGMGGGALKRREGRGAVVRQRSWKRFQVSRAKSFS